MTTKVRKNVYIEQSAVHDLNRFARMNDLSFSQALTIAAWRLLDNPANALRKKDEGRSMIMKESDYLDE